VISFGHILIVLVIILIVFGAGKLPRVMSDLGKGIRSFKEGLEGKGEDNPDESKSTPALPPSKDKE
jgi:sec-independent protein translocase protein TatA